MILKFCANHQYDTLGPNLQWTDRLYAGTQDLSKASVSAMASCDLPTINILKPQGRTQKGRDQLGTPCRASKNSHKPVESPKLRASFSNWKFRAHRRGENNLQVSLPPELHFSKKRETRCSSPKERQREHTPWEEVWGGLNSIVILCWVGNS